LRSESNTAKFFNKHELLIANIKIFNTVTSDETEICAANGFLNQHRKKTTNTFTPTVKNWDPESSLKG
jgi:hypothetical protein